VPPSELERCTRATLLYDSAQIDANMRAVAFAARSAGIRALFAAKSFPHPRVLALAGEHLDGFDVASPGELDAIAGRAGAESIISVVDPTGAAIALVSRYRERVIVGCETVAQVETAPPRAEIAIRISASITGRDPAVGAILDGSGHRQSRFGLATRDEVAALARAARGRRVGLHVHHGPIVATSAERFIASATAALALADFEPAFIDLGGAWHGIADLHAAFTAIRAALPRSIELIVEPGRLYATNAGFACGIVQVARAAGSGANARELRVVDLSRSCHLRWSPVELVAPAPRPGHGQRVLVVGPTCYEDDTLGEWTIEPAHVAERVILRDVPGYALAWNTGFGGVPPADVIVR
jgi:diaminopimelate decarboxylase